MLWWDLTVFKMDYFTDVIQHLNGHLELAELNMIINKVLCLWSASCYEWNHWTVKSTQECDMNKGWILIISPFVQLHSCHLPWIELDMSTTRRLKSPRSLSSTSAHPTMVTLVNIMVMNRWLTSFLFHVNWPPHSWDIAISDSHLETPRSRSWLGSRGNVKQLAQYHINSLPFHFTSIRPTIPEIQLFWNLTLKHPRSRSWVRSKVKVTYHTQYWTDALPVRFTSIRPTIPEIWPKWCLIL